MTDYRLKTRMPRRLRELCDSDPDSHELRLRGLRQLITGRGIHFPLEGDERLTHRDRVGGILDFALRLRDAEPELLGRHRMPHLMRPNRDPSNSRVIDELEPMRIPDGDDQPLSVMLSGPNSTGKSLLAAWLAVRMIGREVLVRTTVEPLLGVLRAGVFGPAPELRFESRQLSVTYERQVVTRPQLADIAIVRDPDFLRQIQEGYDDKGGPTERERIRLLASSRIVIIEDLGWRHGGKPDFARRVWSDFFDRRESAKGTVTIISTNLTEPEQLIEHIDMRGWERLGGLLRRSDGWFDLRGPSRRLGGRAA